MSSTASFEIRGTIMGTPEGRRDLYLPFSLSSSPGGLVSRVTLTTALADAVPVSVPADVRMALIVPPSTNTAPYRVCASTADLGVGMSSVLPALIPVVPSSTFHLFTTAGTTVGGFRVTLY